MNLTKKWVGILSCAGVLVGGFLAFAPVQSVAVACEGVDIPASSDMSFASESFMKTAESTCESFQDVKTSWLFKTISDLSCRPLTASSECLSKLQDAGASMLGKNISEIERNIYWHPVPIKIEIWSGRSCIQNDDNITRFTLMYSNGEPLRLRIRGERVLIAKPANVSPTERKELGLKCS